jgi:integrase
MDAAGDLWPPVRAATMGNAIGLLACSGMRIGEMLARDDADLDIEDGVITVTGKWVKQRQVPVHPTTVQALRAYQQTRGEYRPLRPTNALFITRHGDRPTKGAFLKAFRALLIRSGWRVRARGRGRVRMTFDTRSRCGR